MSALKTDSEFSLAVLTAVMAAPFDYAATAALPLTSITAWEALFDRLGISQSGQDEGKSILIIGGAGDVGSIATLDGNG